ncbi:hypothetical protein EUTSA_v10002970mg, partial [Eutrema salsugineum]
MFSCSVQDSGNVTTPVNTLRYFPSGQTNCYTNIQATSYDVNHLENVVITASLLHDEDKSWFPSEVIFAPASVNISVWLICTDPSKDPLISSIEVYGLDAEMYEDLVPEEGLILRQRFAFGAKKIISYPLDPYGRIWFPSLSNHPTISKLTTSAPSIDITGVSNKPPEIVMSKALSADGFSLSDETLPITGLLVYLALYFSEPQSLGRTQRRSFNVSLDNTHATKFGNGQDGGDEGGGGQSGRSNDDSEGSGGTTTRESNAVGGRDSQI